MTMKMPADKFMSSVKVGEKGQIVIPKEVREMFNIEPGDMLLLLADKERGIAIVDNDGLLDMARNIAGFAGKNHERHRDPALDQTLRPQNRRGQPLFTCGKR